MIKLIQQFFSRVPDQMINTMTRVIPSVLKSLDFDPLRNLPPAPQPHLKSIAAKTETSLPSTSKARRLFASYFPNGIPTSSKIFKHEPTEKPPIPVSVNRYPNALKCIESIFSQLQKGETPNKSLMLPEAIIQKSLALSTSSLEGDRNPLLPQTQSTKNRETPIYLTERTSQSASSSKEQMIPVFKPGKDNSDSTPRAGVTFQEMLFVMILLVLFAKSKQASNEDPLDIVEHITANNSAILPVVEKLMQEIEEESQEKLLDPEIKRAPINFLPLFKTPTKNLTLEKELVFGTVEKTAEETTHDSKSLRAIHKRRWDSAKDLRKSPWARILPTKIQLIPISNIRQNPLEIFKDRKNKIPTPRTGTKANTTPRIPHLPISGSKKTKTSRTPRAFVFIPNKTPRTPKATGRKTTTPRILQQASQKPHRPYDLKPVGHNVSIQTEQTPESPALRRQTTSPPLISNVTTAFRRSISNEVSKTSTISRNSTRSSGYNSEVSSRYKFVPREGDRQGQYIAVSLRNVINTAEKTFSTKVQTKTATKLTKYVKAYLDRRIVGTQIAYKQNDTWYIAEQRLEEILNEYATSQQKPQRFTRN